jgi:hypothetical protein
METEKRIHKRSNLEEETDQFTTGKNPFTCIVEGSVHPKLKLHE